MYSSVSGSGSDVLYAPYYMMPIMLCSVRRLDLTVFNVKRSQCKSASRFNILHDNRILKQMFRHSFFFSCLMVRRVNMINSEDFHTDI